MLRNMTHRSSIFRKYTAALMALVGVVLVTSGAVQWGFTLADSERALAELQYEKAVNASLDMSQFVREIENQVELAHRGASLVSPERRQETYERVRKLATDVSELRYLDADRAEQLRIGPGGITEVGSGKLYLR